MPIRWKILITYFDIMLKKKKTLLIGCVIIINQLKIYIYIKIQPNNYRNKLLMMKNIIIIINIIVISSIYYLHQHLQRATHCLVFYLSSLVCNNGVPQRGLTITMALVIRPTTARWTKETSIACVAIFIFITTECNYSASCCCQLWT